MIRFSILFFSFLFTIFSFAQTKKALNITRTDDPPKIDGLLNEAIWLDANIATDFTQFRPNIGVEFPDSERTEVMVTYDDDAIYFGAYLYDDPDKIMSQVTKRDNFGQNDFFMIVLNPNNDAQNNTIFIVQNSGSQADAIATLNNEDYGWNAVWKSAVKMHDDGWSVEIKIPYRALRFANEPIQTWGIQFQREVRRERARYSWNPIDPTTGSSFLYHGELTGLTNLKPPVRLNLYPFISGVGTSFDGQSETDINFGLDVKYGITDNFTLDATLVPDFSQVGFDRLTLNLGPFEQTFNEQRQFFKEGVDLFNKGNLFFSRRVGNAPITAPELNDNEKFVNYPQALKVLNAVKISGRTKNGLGIGIFNAITEKTDVRILDTLSGNSRTVVAEPFSNYNILVIDQQFNNNSSVSIINTNVSRKGNFRDANVTGLLMDVSNKRNTYNIYGQVKMSKVNLSNNTSTGYSSFFAARKIHGNFRYSFDHSFADKNYDINDLGLIRRNNYNNIGIDASYQTFKPSKELNNYRINAYLNYRQLAEPNVFTGTNLGIEFRATSTSLNSFGFDLNFEPGKQFDYFESRQEEKYFIYENAVFVGAWISSNYNKTFAYDIRSNISTLFENGRDLFKYRISVSPRMRVNEHFLLDYDFRFDYNNGSRGYATSENDESIFGERKRVIISNSLSANYNFNPLHVLSLTLRKYWDTVTYDKTLFTLQDNGRLTKSSGYTVNSVENNPNINYSTWNLDLSYSWEMAPGSFLTALYRNQLFNRDQNADISFSDNLNLLFNQPIQHTFSLKLQYFIDYGSIKSVFRKKRDS
ncbi:DUF5916 domain-containing protein [Changchengzhania lutea]|uniref:DUF5916 domain-containing protein n=1 Tax=Changchengzhania lutea TaxID=2049305 RepID=UPI00115E5BD8|nr:DUF5916 domain-containing protein [Changchengzhania lutea]